MKSTHAYLPVPTQVRIIYFSLRATSTCSRVVFSSIKPSLGQNCNLAKGYNQSPIHGFSHPYSHFWRSIWLQCCLFPIPTTSLPYLLHPENLPSRPSPYSHWSSPVCVLNLHVTILPWQLIQVHFLHGWINVLLHIREIFAYEGEQNLSSQNMPL